MEQFHRRSVLCIGNDFLNLNLRCSLLHEHGWRVHSAGGGPQGVILFNQEAVDVVVLDLNGEGSQTALITGELKRLRSTIPVIAVVEHVESLTEGALQQVDAVVLKSEEATKLLEALRTVVGKK